MDATWAGVVATLLIQLGVGLFIVGRYAERVARILQWIDDEAEPQLADHERRLVILEHRK